MKDGIGAIIIKSINGNSITFNNEEYNKLLLLNKNKLTDTVGLKELIVSGDIVVDASTLNSINGNGLSNPTGLPVDGIVCDDKNPLTTNDIYTNNVCLGTSIVGTSCDDINANTENDVYDTNGVCVGTPINTLTKVDIFNDGSGVALYTFDNTSNGVGSFEISSTGKFSSDLVLSNQSAYFQSSFSQHQIMNFSFFFRADKISTYGYILSNKQVSISLYNNYLLVKKGDSFMGYSDGINRTYTSSYNHISLNYNYNNNTFDIYYNGTKLNFVSGYGSWYSDTSFCLGAPRAYGQYGLEGYIDQLRIFNKALTQEEVTQLYNEH